MKDELGDRMKSYYEDRTRFYLPRRSYTIIRIDGKSFHTFTRGLKRPFDVDLITDMNTTAAYLCKNITGARFAYVQSDEISILITDFPYEDAEGSKNVNVQAWFDANLQKMCSVSASMATRAFNEARLFRLCSNLHLLGEKMKWAEFDSRVFQIPQYVEVQNYFIWRYQDCVRNSISSVAQSQFSHSELNGRTTNAMQELLFQERGINWSKFPEDQKNGRLIIKQTYEKPADENTKSKSAIRTKWIAVPYTTAEMKLLIPKI